jgi:Type IIA topoisomerase (DNA gyrase/topo II, topoisomerase IV), A subunit
MNFKELLKARGLTDEQINEIIVDMGSHKLFITKEEKIEERYNKLKLQKEDLEDNLSKANSIIKTLKADNATNETLQATIKTHEATIATMKSDHETKIKDMSIEAAITSKLTDTKYPELLATKFDKTKLSISEDGTVLGIAEQLTSIKENYKDLFTPPVTGKDPIKGGRSTLGTEKNPWSKEHFNLTEQGKIMRDDPELAVRLKASVQ